MKLRSILLLLIFALIISTSRVTAQANGQIAQQSAQTWLALVDSNKYSESWREASQLFKSHVSDKQWQSAVKAARSPPGVLQSRALKGAKDANTLPGAPDGQYVVIQYDSRFENKPAAVETVTEMLEKDGQWRVAGYFVR